MSSVLICDDHLLFAESLALALQQRGHDVARAADPSGAVSLARTRGADVCLLDRHFPDADGLDAIAPLRAAAPGMRVVMLSGSALPDVVARAREAGAEFVSKEQPVRELVEVVEEAGRPVAHSRRRPPVPSAESAIAASLTAREREVLACLVAGLETKTLARDLGITYATARSHIQSLLTKLNVHSKLEAVAYAVGQGLVAPPARPPAWTGGP